MADLPAWTPIADVAAPASDGSGRIVGLVASEQAAGRGWAPSAALNLARAWSAAGSRVIVVDAALQAPSLHEAADLPNREGLSDAALHGASVERVSQPVDEGSFFLITSGTPVAYSRDVVRSGRWHRLADGMTEAGVTVLLYVRDGYAETAAFLGAASDIVILAAPNEPPPSSVDDLVPLVRAVTGPDGGAPAGASAPTGGTPRDESVAAPVETPSRSEPPSRSEASPVVAGGGGIGRTILLLVGALLVAAGLGYLLTSIL